MAEYIERETAKKVLAFGVGVTAANALDKVPAADVAPVVHGRWLEADDGDGIVCSVCGTDFCTLLNETEKFNGCPNCGARMDGE